MVALLGAFLLKQSKCSVMKMTALSWNVLAKILKNTNRRTATAAISRNMRKVALYHDTWRLLKKYRDVTWSLELSIRQVKNQFRIDYDCSIEDFLESIYMAGADLGGTDIENHARCIERSYKMLTLLENSVNLLRTHHQSGEVYYWILYYSFLSPQKLKNVEEIIEALHPHIRDISFSTYYRLRKAAVEALSSVLWGFSAQDTLKTLDCFFPPDV